VSKGNFTGCIFCLLCSCLRCQVEHNNSGARLEARVLTLIQVNRTVCMQNVMPSPCWWRQPGKQSAPGLTTAAQYETQHTHPNPTKVHIPCLGSLNSGISNLGVLSVQKVSVSGRATRRWPRYFLMRRSPTARPEPGTTFWSDSSLPSMRNRLVVVTMLIVSVEVSRVDSPRLLAAVDNTHRTA